MGTFYFYLWFYWALKVTLNSLLTAAVFSLIMTFFLYIQQGAIDLTSEVIDALLDIAIFWFPIFWSFVLLIVLFRSVKYIFENCFDGYKFQLLSCNKTKVISSIGYGDLVKVWRKWFMLLIWLSAIEMIFALVFTKVFTSYESLFEWFNIYILYTFILIAGYISFIVIASKCRQIRISMC